MLIDGIVKRFLLGSDYVCKNIVPSVVSIFQSL